MPTWNLSKRKGGIFAGTGLPSAFVVVPESAMLSVTTQVEICLLILKHNNYMEGSGSATIK